MAAEATQGEATWYRDAVIYELHVKCFRDSSGDGIGDFQGLQTKLDYLQELGVTAVWLLPFYRSPLKDDGYDISDYYDVHPDYGNLRDFRQFLRAAHKRGIRVITELVINHTSDRHRWFQRARRARPGSKWRDFYVWSDTPDKYKDARIIFKDFEHSNWSWDPQAQAYYWHRFYSHQPDLNFDSPSVRREILRVVDFWLNMGVDGLRLDAVPYLFERENTNCENLPETHAFLKELRAHVDKQFEGRMLLAEANQWPSDAAEYFGQGDECHMAFHFPVMPRLFMAVQMEDRFPIVDMLEQSMDIPTDCQWAMFLRNHDELTLEMVTDEERDYMYRAYARDPRARVHLGIRRRLAPLMENDRGKIELLNFLLFSLPGTPVLYYGDEIGMGDDYYLGDRNGVRTPMQWSSDRNAGFSSANPQQLYLPLVIDLQYHYMAVNVENQANNPSSLLWFMRRLIGTRNRFKAFGRGSMQFAASNNPHVLSFVRSYGDEHLLVVANLSRFCQSVLLDMRGYAGRVPEEVFGGSRFPMFGEQPYSLSLGPHNAYWFELHEQKEEAMTLAGEQVPRLALKTAWENVTDEAFRSGLSGILRPYMRKCRWFGGKNRVIRSTSIVDSITIGRGANCSHLLLVEAAYVGGRTEIYLMPVSFVRPGEAAEGVQLEPISVIGELALTDGEGTIYDGAYNAQLRGDLLEMILRKRSIKRGRSRLASARSIKLGRLLEGAERPQESRVLKGQQSNTSVVYDNSFFFKLYRRLEGGHNPEIDLSRCLTEYTDFANFPAYVGALEWQSKDSEPLSVGLLVKFMPNESDGWVYTLDAVGRYLTNAAAHKEELKEVCGLPMSILEFNADNMPELLADLISPVYIDMIKLLAQRTAEFHKALASLSRWPDTAPEPFSVLYQKSVYQSMRAMTSRVLSELESGLPNMAEETATEARKILDAKQEILGALRNITGRKINAMKIRIHGDYHLGQVLFTGKDFVIIDFEGEPARPLGERQLKRSPLRDIAGMIRSFHYAAHGALVLKPMHTPDMESLRQWADIWYYCVAGVFLNAYLDAVGNADFLPKERGDLEMLLAAFLLEKSIYEIGYELNNRPDWLPIPLRGVLQTLRGKL